MAHLVVYWPLMQTSGVQFPVNFSKFLHTVTCTHTHTHIVKWRVASKQSLEPLKISQPRYEWLQVLSLVQWLRLCGSVGKAVDSHQIVQGSSLRQLNFFVKKWVVFFRAPQLKYCRGFERAQPFARFCHFCVIFSHLEATLEHLFGKIITQIESPE